MWDSPAKVTAPLAGMIRLQAMQSGLTHREITVEGSETEQTLFRWLKDIVGMINASRDLPSFTPLLRKYIVAETLHIESNRRYATLLGLEARLQRLGDELTPEFGAELGQAVDAILTTFLGGVILLLGTETRVLVGVSNGRPSWKKIPKVSSEEAVFALRDSILTTYGILGRIGPSEVWMVPEFREFDLAAKQRYEQEDGYLEVNRQLIEEAFYRQRYLIDPEGVFVKVTNSRDVTGIYLKVQARGDALVDVLARVETTAGAILFVVTEEYLIGRAEHLETFVNGSCYYDYVVCQIYHDLVTAMPVSGTLIIRAGSGDGAPPPVRGDGPTWTVIPRKVRNIIREPRTEIPQRPVTEPHRVTGHLRRAPMTDKHREALLEFERKTGLEVLRFVPEGHTFVRPHLSPRASAEDLAALPRFIRYRIQQALEAKMKASELRD